MENVIGRTDKPFIYLKTAYVATAQHANGVESLVDSGHHLSPFAIPVADTYCDSNIPQNRICGAASAIHPGIASILMSCLGR